MRLAQAAQAGCCHLRCCWSATLAAGWAAMRRQCRVTPAALPGLVATNALYAQLLLLPLLHCLFLLLLLLLTFCLLCVQALPPQPP